MKTYMAHAETVERKWYVVDAAGVPLGRLASRVASVLRGKNKPTFTPNVDCGDFVIIINTDKAVLTGKKLENKFYRYHTGYIGGRKERPCRIRSGEGYVAQEQPRQSNVEETQSL